MRLTDDQWQLLGQCVGFVCREVGEERTLPILDEIGPDGRQGAFAGLDPATGPARHELVHALRGLLAAVNRLDAPAMNDDLLKVMIQAEDMLEACDGCRRTR